MCIMDQLSIWELFFTHSVLKAFAMLILFVPMYMQLEGFHVKPPWLPFSSWFLSVISPTTLRLSWTPYPCTLARKLGVFPFLLLFTSKWSSKRKRACKGAPVMCCSSITGLVWLVESKGSVLKAPSPFSLLFREKGFYLEELLFFPPPLPPSSTSFFPSQL